MFDRIAIPGLQSTFLDNTAIFNEVPGLREDLLGLIDADVVFEPVLPKAIAISDPQYEYYKREAREGGKGVLKSLLGIDLDLIVAAKSDEKKRSEADAMLNSLNELKAPDIIDRLKTDEFAQALLSMAAYMARLSCVEIREVMGLDAYPVLFHRGSSHPLDITATKNDVVEIVLKNLPVPAPDTSMEQILDFRSDPEARHRFLDLRNWMSEMSRAKLSHSEIEEKLIHLMSEYARSMQIHKIRTTENTLETIVIATADVLGGLAGFKWGAAAKALFSIRKRKTSLLEGEFTSPGRAVAYLMTARETFRAQ